LYAFSAVDATYISVGCDGNYFYTARWLGNEITRHDMDGSNPFTFTIPGVSVIRDFTYDGTYFYAVNQTASIFKLDLANETLVATIQASGQGIGELQHIAYDPTLDGGSGGFWTGSVTSIRTVSMNGTQLSVPYSDPSSDNWYMGAVYDPYSDPATPYLWLMSQIPGGHAIVRQFNINTLTFTTYTYDVGADQPQCGGNAGGGMTSYIDKNRKFRIAADIQTDPNLNLIYEMADLMLPGAPAPVSGAIVSAGMSGSLNLLISWTNPNQTYSGAPLTELTAVKVYEGNTLVHTASDPAIGGFGSFMRTVSAPGYYTYTLIPENSQGTGTITTVSTSWIGHDMPAAPRYPALVIDETVADESWTITASWTAPSAGLHGGFFTPDSLVYDVYRMPGNILVLEDQAVTSFTETITEPGTYYYTITAKNHVGLGGSVNTPAQDLCWNIVVPWEEKFLTSTFPPVCWKTYTQGSVGWRIITNPTYSSPYSVGIWSYESGARNTWLVSPELTLPESGNYMLEFQSRIDMIPFYGSSEIWVSTESNDPNSGTFVLLKQLVSGVDFEATASWRTLTVSLTEYLGTSVYIGFRYVNNNYDDHHAWFIDDIVIRDVPGIDAVAKKVFGSLTPMVGEPFLFKATIGNIGGLPLTDYTVKLVDENDNILAVGNSSPAIAIGATEFISMNWSPTTAGNFTLYVVVEATGDGDLSNNKSEPFPVVIQPANGVFEGKIGNGTTSDPFAPFGFMMLYGISQSLHFDHEIIGRGGSIIQLQYFNDFTTSLVDIPIKIWMANTMLTRLDDWLPESEFTLVFDGYVTFPEGQQTITIPLDQPFSYTGNNLVIMARPIGLVIPVPGLKAFFATTTPEFPNRSLRFFSNFGDFTWMQSGTSANYHANITLTIANDVMGSISGTVTSNGTTPVEGATVEIVGAPFQRTTDANGAYSFDFLVPGEYQLKASKFGHFDATSETITVVEDENTVVNFVLAPNPTGTISGKVTGNNAPNGLANVAITLSGYDTYSTTTDALGNYSIPNVFGGHTYTIKALLQGYQSYTSTIEVTSGNITRNIVLNEIAYPAVGVVAEVVSNKVVVTWREPDSETLTAYRYDSGTNSGYVGWPNGTRNSIVGAAHRGVTAELYNMSWFSTNHINQPAYDLWVLGLNDAGYPDRNDIIFTAQNVPNTPGQWCTFEFPQPLYIANGFFIGVSPSFGGFTSLGIDEPDNEYPFVLDVNLTSFGPNESWTCLSVDGFYTNAMIRAEGVSLGKTARFGDKGLSDFVVYRLLEGQQSNESSWELLASNLSETTYTDTDWANLSIGRYRYAVKAAYTGNILSSAKFSNMLEKGNSISTNIFKDIALFPNPFTNEINISQPELVKSVQITDIVGKQVKTDAFNGKTISCGALSSGIYFIELENFFGEKIIYKVVKK